MASRGLTCKAWEWGIKTYCPNGTNPSAVWDDNKYCQQSCFDFGLPYAGEDCPIPPPASPPPAPKCTDTPTAWMDKQDPPLTCASWTYGLDQNCRSNSRWEGEEICKQSCWDRGLSWNGDTCAVQPPSAPPPAPECTDTPTGWMTSQGLTCAAWTYGLKQNCEDNPRWEEDEICKKSCFDIGMPWNGYTCATYPPTAPPPAGSAPCTDEPSAYMEKQDPPLTCAVYTYGISRYCANGTSPSSYWASQKYCQQSCFSAGLPYPGDDCPAIEPPTPPAPPVLPCKSCVDVKTPWMIANGKECATYLLTPYAEKEDFCTTTQYTYNGYCSKTCADLGKDYENCCI